MTLFCKTSNSKLYLMSSLWECKHPAYSPERERMSIRGVILDQALLLWWWIFQLRESEALALGRLLLLSLKSNASRDEYRNRSDSPLKNMVSFERISTRPSKSRTNRYLWPIIVIDALKQGVSSLPWISSSFVRARARWFIPERAPTCSGRSMIHSSLYL
jgi:hypothetical protein